ncbi:hypothetical protein [Bradyrhizobium sp. NAS80.1]|nr:hypothetical protein [Bradyrhizobium sp. NAS80.1]
MNALISRVVANAWRKIKQTDSKRFSLSRIRAATTADHSGADDN